MPYKFPDVYDVGNQLLFAFGRQHVDSNVLLGEHLNDVGPNHIKPIVGSSAPIERAFHLGCHSGLVELMNEGDEVLSDLPDVVLWLCGQREQERLGVFSPQALGLPQREDWDVI